MRQSSRSLSPARGDPRTGKSSTPVAASRLLQPTLASSSKAKKTPNPFLTARVRTNSFQEQHTVPNFSATVPKVAMEHIQSAPANNQQQSAPANTPDQQQSVPSRARSFKGVDISRPPSRSKPADGGLSAAAQAVDGAASAAVRASSSAAAQAVEGASPATVGFSASAATGISSSAAVHALDGVSPATVGFPASAAVGFSFSAAVQAVDKAGIFMSDSQHPNPQVIDTIPDAAEDSISNANLPIVHESAIIKESLINMNSSQRTHAATETEVIIAPPVGSAINPSVLVAAGSIPKECLPLINTAENFQLVGVSSDMGISKISTTVDTYLSAPVLNKSSSPSAAFPQPTVPSNQVQQGRDKPRRKPPRSFADVAAGKPKPPDVFAANFTAIRPIKQGNFVSITIPDSIYQEQLNSFRFSIIGRMIHRKGDTPLNHESLKSELDKIMGFTEPWNLITMGRGFFTLKLGSEADLRRVSRSTSVRCSVEVMYFREWSPDFDPVQAQSSITHIWVKIYHLPAFYWHPEVLTGILSAAGTVVKLDGNTMSGAYGKFARALVEVDMAQPLLESVMIGCGAASFFVSLEYENLPSFCPICQVVGHALDKCRRNKSSSSAKEETHSDKVVQKGSVAVPVHEKDWVVKRDRRRKNVEQHPFLPDTQSPTAEDSGALITNNSFQLLNSDDHPGELDGEATFADYLEKVTVPVDEFNAKVSSCSIEVQNELSNIDLQLQKLEKKMKAEQVAKALVSNENKGTSSALAPVKSNQSYDQLKANFDAASSAASSGLRLVNERLSQASLSGAQPTDFTVVTTNNQVASLNKVARRSWADLDDSDEDDGSRVSPSDDTQSLQ